MLSFQFGCGESTTRRKACVKRLHNCPNLFTVQYCNCSNTRCTLIESFTSLESKNQPIQKSKVLSIPVKRKNETEVGSDTADYCGNTLRGAGNSGDICACFAYDSFSSTCSCMLCKKFTKILWLALKQQVVWKLH